MHSDNVEQLMSTSRRGIWARTRLSCLGIAVTLTAVGCGDAGGDGDAVAATSDDLVITSECRVWGSGTHTDDDLVFRGSVVSDSHFAATGQWQHEFPGGEIFVGAPNEMQCIVGAHVTANFRGNATLDGVPGFTFVAYVDAYGTGVQLIESRTLTASRYYWPNGWADDGWADHTSFAIPAELPVSVGSGLRGNATLRFQRAAILDHVTCDYRSTVAPGDRYTLRDCRSDTGGTPPVVATSAF